MNIIAGIVITSFFVVTLLIKCSTSVQMEIVVNERPIIGILAQEIFNSNQTYIAASYVKFIEGAGGQVVPIFVNQNESYVKNIFSKINGVLLPGGSVDFKLSDGTRGYADIGRQLLKLAKISNDAGDYFPVWGTCLGFELMVYDEANGTEVRSRCGSWNIVDKLKYTKETMSSQMFSKAPKSIVNLLSSQPLSANFHNFCISPENFSKFGLDKTYSTLSINYDHEYNLTYISSLEHRRYPFFAVQFHPEKNLYEWTPKENIPHSPSAVLVAQYFANFFVNQARRNTQKFSSIDEENKNLIYKYEPEFSGVDGSTFVQKYMFPQS